MGNTNDDHGNVAVAVAEKSQRGPVMFNIPDPNPLRGNNILIEMNANAARMLCDILDDIDLNGKEDAPIYALGKHIRRYYGKIAEERKRKNSVASTDKTTVEPTKSDVEGSQS